MNPAPTKLYSILKTLTKQEILKFSRVMCSHRQPLLSHPNCLEQYIGYKPKVGFLDIETSNFSASFGVVVTWSIKEENGKIYDGFLRDEDFDVGKGNYDKRILAECVDAMMMFDRLVVYWGKDRRFDIPFLRTRAVSMGVGFPLYQENIVTDLYDVVKNKFKFGRNSLYAACSQLGIASKDTPLTPQTWMDATIGRDKKAMKLILAHNHEDVISTEALWHRINSFANLTKTSI